jgi:hypothetical protein
MRVVPDGNFESDSVFWRYSTNGHLQVVCLCNEGSLGTLKFLGVQLQLAGFNENTEMRGWLDAG